MQNLPCQEELPIERLASTFNDVTNSYKYYWFLAILEELESKPVKIISLDDLALRMLSLVWYPLDFYKLSFGKQDSFKEIAQEVSNYFKIRISPSDPDVYQQLKQKNSNSELIRILSSVKRLVRYVPYRFLRPFFSEEIRGLKDTFVNKAIVELSAKYISLPQGKVMYQFQENKNSIELHPIWVTYLVRHLQTIRGFIYFELVRFLHKHNPHVPGLSEKLFRPRTRKLNDATKFWCSFLKEFNDYTCPYSSEIIKPDNFSIDHFIPWSYTAHDSLWNLIPTSKNVNSSKSNYLPALPHYLPELCSRQFLAFKFLFNSNLKNKSILLEDYVQLFGQDLGAINQAGEEPFSKRLQETIYPLVQVASNLGFKPNWIYQVN